MHSLYNSPAGATAQGRRSVMRPMSWSTASAKERKTSMPSGAWQKYAYRQRYGIIGAKNGQVLPKGCS